MLQPFLILHDLGDVCGELYSYKHCISNLHLCTVCVLCKLCYNYLFHCHASTYAILLLISSVSFLSPWPSGMTDQHATSASRCKHLSPTTFSSSLLSSHKLPQSDLVVHGSRMPLCSSQLDLLCSVTSTTYSIIIIIFNSILQ